MFGVPMEMTPMQKLLFAAALVGLALTLPGYAQDQKSQDQMMGSQRMTMSPDMMARMNRMMDRCEKMMGGHDMKGMKRHHKRS